MKIEKALYRAIVRSEETYSLYLKDKLLFQALRIYEANREVYKLLTEYYYICPEEKMVDVTQYLFHLNDWFNNFEANKDNVSLKSKFIFDRLDDQFPFPENFKNNLT